MIIQSYRLMSRYSGCFLRKNKKSRLNNPPGT